MLEHVQNLKNKLNVNNYKWSRDISLIMPDLIYLMCIYSTIILQKWLNKYIIILSHLLSYIPNISYIPSFILMVFI
jgi:hypothetical protein